MTAHTQPIPYEPMLQRLAAAIRQIESVAEFESASLSRSRLEFSRAKQSLEHELATALRQPKALTLLRNEQSEAGRALRSTTTGKRNSAKQAEHLERLKADEDRLGESLRRVEEQLAQRQQEVNEIASMLDGLERARSDVLKQIANRGLLLRLIKTIFGDVEAKRQAQIERKIAASGLRRSDVEKAFREAERKRATVDRERNTLAYGIERLKREIGEIEKVEAVAAEKREALQQRYDDLSERVREAEQKERMRVDKEQARIQVRLEAARRKAEAQEEELQGERNKRWTAALKQIDGLCRRIRMRQPRLDEMGTGIADPGWPLPDALAFGRLRLSKGNWKGYVPRLLSFPFAKALWWSANDSEQEQTVRALLLRLLTALPVGMLHVMVADPRRLGQSLGELLPLISEGGPIEGSRVFTRADEIENSLRRETDSLEDLLQRRFRTPDATWRSYNADHRDAPLPYRLLLMFDVPDQMTERSLHYLGRLVEHGPRCGVLPILSLSQATPDNRHYERFRKEGERSLQAVSSLDISLQPDDVPHLSVEVRPEPWPNRRDLQRIVAAIAVRHARERQRARPIRDLWNDIALWREPAVRGLVAPLGWQSDGSPVHLEIGGISTEHHVLLAGRSGSGKSNLLHVLIHSLCHRYGPDQLRIFLLDYKQATELSAYACPALPHAALVATESDPEYGVTVLEHLAAEIERRAAIFKSEGVRDIGELEMRTGKAFPRLLLVIDEFQILFSEGRQVADPAERLLSSLLRQGRAFGLHVLLATQTLKGIQSVSMGQLISQIGLRICLACGEEDSAAILGPTNWDGAKLNSPPEAILNDHSGARSANRLFRVPLADRVACSNHLLEMVAKAEGLGLRTEVRVFDGTHLPTLPGPDVFSSLLPSGRNDIHLLIGKRLSFEESFLLCSLARRPGANLLCVGPETGIRQGLIHAILLSLGGHPKLDELVYYGPRDVETTTQAELQRLRSSGVRLSIQPPDWTGHLGDITAPADDRFGVLIVDGLDYARAFHSAGATILKPRQPGQSKSPAESFRSWLDEGPQKRWWTVAVADNWRRVSTTCRDFLSGFQMRIGYGLNEEDGCAFASGGVGRLQGMQRPNRAFLSDQHRNELVWFRPFNAQTDKAGGDWNE